MSKKKQGASPYITTTEALSILENSWLANQFKPNLETLIRWAKEYGFGFKFAGRWQIDKKKFQDFIDNKPV